jgi:hypothetical protein
MTIFKVKNKYIFFGLGMMAYICNPSIQEAETEES